MNYKLYNNQSLVYLALLAALLIISTIIYLTIQADKQHFKNTNWVFDTHKVLTESQRLFSLVKDAQRGQRGYILAQDSSYLSPYHQGKSDVFESLRRLQKLTTDQERQQKRLLEVEQLIHQSFVFWDSTIVLNDTEGPQAAIEWVKTGRGKKLIDRIGVILNDFEQLEQVLLHQRQEQFKKSKENFIQTQIIGWLSSLALLFISFMLLFKQIARKEKLARTLKEKVQERTQELQASNEELQSSLDDVFRINSELQRTNIDLDNFVYTASHDLRSPITNLQGLLGVLIKRIGGKIESSEEKILELMSESVVRLNRTIKDLSEISKIQKEAYEKENICFKEILHDVSNDIAFLIHESKAEIITDFEEECLYYPYTHLRSILYNLLSNAIKYRAVDRPPCIRITTKKEQEWLQLSVSDNGLGLREDQLDKIFLMFKRLHTHVDGSGVGLYMVKRIIENNGGRITVESEQGMGTTFHLFFKWTSMNNTRQETSFTTEV